MKKVLISSLLVLVIILLSIQTASADGVIFSDYHKHMFEPSQKAVITWDGITEEMVLSTAVRSDDIANFAWVVPIQSSTDPEITAGNITVFELLVNYFTPDVQSNRYGKAMSAEGDVIVIESKEVDVYDITVLKATNAQALVNWLNEHNYKTPESAAPVFQKYCDKEDFYFIANRIDLTNKFATSLRVVNKWIEISGIENSPYLNEYELENLNSKIISKFMHLNEYYDWAASMIACDFSYEEAMERNWRDVFFIPKEDYERLRSTHAYIPKESCFQTSLVAKREQTKFQQLSSEVYKKIDPEILQLDENELSGLYNIHDSLESGFATPLKFEFTPVKPFYPLEISSLNQGNTLVEIYVLTDKPVKDVNEILEATESKRISSTLKSKLQEHLNVGDAKYVTRLSYEGALSELHSDAELEKQDVFFLRGFWDWLTNIF